jgi:hypothetical protein
MAGRRWSISEQEGSQGGVAQLVKNVSFKRSPRKRALNLSINSFCCGLPGTMQCHMRRPQNERDVPCVML